MRLRDEERLIYEQTSKGRRSSSSGGTRQGVNVAGRALDRPASLGRHQWPWRSRWTAREIEKD